MNEELNKKIAEWVGVVFHQDGKQWCPNKDGDVWYSPQSLPDFPNDLNACFKYVVPERISEVSFMYASNCVSCDIEDLEGKFFEGHVNTDSIEEAWQKSAMAFSLAVEKLIDGH